MLQNVDADSSTVSSSEPRSSKRRGNSRDRRTCVTKTLVGIVFALLLLGISFVPLILYFVEKGWCNLQQGIMFKPYNLYF